MIECVQKLASTTFVQTVTAAPLALIAPLLLLGFRVRSTATKRMCAVIINNMSKLVEDPEDAAPFLPKLMPALEKAKEEIPTPRRAPCAARRSSSSSPSRSDSRSTLPQGGARRRRGGGEEVRRARGEDGLPRHHHRLLVNCKVEDDDDWADELKPYGVDEAEAKAAFKTLAKMYFADAEEEDDDDDAEQLCDCKFTLAYGSKVLLHNTRLKLKRGHKYGLLGGNDSGKTTLMRAIANEQVDGFPGVGASHGVRRGGHHRRALRPALRGLHPRGRAHQEGGVSEEVVERMLLSVGFGEMQNGARNLVTFLSGGWRMKLRSRAPCASTRTSSSWTSPPTTST